MNETTTSASTKEIAAQTRRTAPNHWRGADGIPISLHDWVEQVVQDKGHPALLSRIYQRGQVLGRSANSLYVRFERDNHLIALRPDHVRLIGTPEGC